MKTGEEGGSPETPGKRPVAGMGQGCSSAEETFYFLFNI